MYFSVWFGLMWKILGVYFGVYMKKRVKDNFLINIYILGCLIVCWRGGIECNLIKDKDFKIFLMMN